MATSYYELKARIIELSTAFHEGDEATRNALRKRADFFPLSGIDSGNGLRSMVIRIQGQMFLVEDTRGGETGVFSLLLPMM